MGKFKSTENMMIGPATREDCIKKYDELKLKTLDNEATGKVAKALNIRITKKTSARLRGLFLHNIRRKQLADIQNVDPAESASGMDDDDGVDEAADKKVQAGAKKGKAAKK